MKTSTSSPNKTAMSESLQLVCGETRGHDFFFFKKKVACRTNMEALSGLRCFVPKSERFILSRELLHRQLVFPESILQPKCCTSMRFALTKTLRFIRDSTVVEPTCRRSFRLSSPSTLLRHGLRSEVLLLPCSWEQRSAASPTFR